MKKLLLAAIFVAACATPTSVGTVCETVECKGYGQQSNLALCSDLVVVTCDRLFACDTTDKLIVEGCQRAGIEFCVGTKITDMVKLYDECIPAVRESECSLINVGKFPEICESIVE